MPRGEPGQAESGAEKVLRSRRDDSPPQRDNDHPEETVSKTAAAPQPRLDLTAIRHHLELGDLESLVRFYAHGAVIELHGPGASRSLGGPIGLREGLERIVAGGLKHELRLAAVTYSGGYVVDRCSNPGMGKTVAWGGLTICRGLITRHIHSPAWGAVR
jgi:hypothetical protein